MNSVANGKVRRMTPFKRLYVQSAAGDAGGAIGAAMYVWHQLNTSPIGSRPSALAGDQIEGRFVMDHAYCGPHYANAEIEALLAARAADLKAQGCEATHIADEAELCRRTAAAVADGLVVGWFQGRMEWGPRALGNRSIVCDPRRADMKDILNLKIKRRESFRPFAPSILREYVSEWFEEDGDVPFMMQVYPDPRSQARADPRGHPCRRIRPAADRASPDQRALLAPDRCVPRADRRADGAQHLVQRERAGRVPTGGGARLLPEDEDGRARHGQQLHPSGVSRTATHL